MSTATTHPAPSTNGNGRNARGQFTKGNKGGPGNPFAGSVAKLRKAALQIVTPEEIQGVFRILLLRAQGGHLPAIKLLLAYTIGQPAATVDPDEVDAEADAREPVDRAEVVEEVLEDLLRRLAEAAADDAAAPAPSNAAAGPVKPDAVDEARQPPEDDHTVSPAPPTVTATPCRPIAAVAEASCAEQPPLRKCPSSAAASGAPPAGHRYQTGFHEAIRGNSVPCSLGVGAASRAAPAAGPARLAGPTGEGAASRPARRGVEGGAPSQAAASAPAHDQHDTAGRSPLPNGVSRGDQGQ
jgi:hypothetical protein